MIDQQGLQNNIELTGALKHEEVLALMQRTRLLLHPSSYEGFSTVCLEAVYSGARVISFVQPMNQEIKNWHVVHTTQEMGKKALEILQSPFTAESVRTNSIDDIAKQMMHLFDEKV